MEAANENVDEKNVEKRRGAYFVIRKNGELTEYGSKPELTKQLSATGTDDVVHVFKGHRLSIETKKVDRVTVN